MTDVFHLNAGNSKAASLTGDASNRTLLRMVTKDVHAATERIWFSRDTFESLVHYRGFLAALLHCHEHLGLPAAKCRNDGNGVAEEQVRIQSLRSDLGKYRAQVFDTGRQMSADYAWGIGYALNGSSLGASMILKSGALPAGWPRTYFKSLQNYAKSGELARFFAGLNAAVIDIETARRGAEAVFANLGSARLD